MANIKTDTETKTDTEAKSDTEAAKSETPFMDVGRIIEQFQLPGVDVNAIVEAQRKDIEALTEANRQAYDGMKALLDRQAEMLKAAMAEWQAAVKDMAGKSPSENAAKQAELAGLAFGKALANMRELAEMAAKSRDEAWEIVNKRFQENLADLRKLLQPK